MMLSLAKMQSVFIFKALQSSPNREDQPFLTAETLR